MARRRKTTAGRGSPEASRRRGFPGLPVIMAVGGLALVGWFVVSALLSGGQSGESGGPGGAEWPPPGAKTAAIVDQLSLTQPNPDFAASARALLTQAGYDVDYYPGEEVTVELYRELPTHDYDLVILRVHSGRFTEVDEVTGEEELEPYVSLFTGEPYNTTKYMEDQLQQWVSRSYYYEGADPLFGIVPDFIRHSMRGRFNETLVVMMGCDGLRSQDTAEAFLDMGASAFVSWNRPVSAQHTDTATQRLLELVVLEGVAVEEAVTRTALEVGPDPSYGAELRVLSDGG